MHKMNVPMQHNRDVSGIYRGIYAEIFIQSKSGFSSSCWRIDTIDPADLCGYPDIHRETCWSVGCSLRWTLHASPEIRGQATTGESLLCRALACPQHLAPSSMHECVGIIPSELGLAEGLANKYLYQIEIRSMRCDSMLEPAGDGCCAGSYQNIPVVRTLPFELLELKIISRPQNLLGTVVRGIF